MTRETLGGRLVHDPWLATILGRDTYGLSIDGDLAAKLTDEGSVERRRLRELQSVPVFMYAKVPTDSVVTARALEHVGFGLVDTSVVFEKPLLQPVALRAGECVLRMALPEDEPEVVSLARSSFQYSRFHLDEQIPDTVADTIKAEWVANYFRGNRGDEMVVACIADKPVGFLLLIRGDTGDLTIDLIAVGSTARGKGAASDMIGHAEAQPWSCSRMLVGTQVANVPSIKLYEKLGFRMLGSSYVFHYHNQPFPSA